MQSDVVKIKSCMNMPSDLTSFTLTNAVLAEFPHTSASDVQAATMRKCNRAILYRIPIFFLDMYKLKLFCIVLFYFTCLK